MKKKHALKFIELSSETEKWQQQKLWKSKKPNSGTVVNLKNSMAPCELQQEFVMEFETEAQESYQKKVMLSRAIYKYHTLANCSSYSTEHVNNMFVLVDFSY